MKAMETINNLNSSNVFAQDPSAMVSLYPEKEEQTKQKDNRNQKVFYIANAPQLAIIGYGSINTSGLFVDTDTRHQPEMWASALQSVGLYRVTHNLGTLNYLITICQCSSAIAQVTNITTTTFDIQQYNNGLSLTSGTVSFVAYTTP